MPSVMLIDADVQQLRFDSEALTARGASVQMFADGNEALSTLRSSRPDLILLCVELGRLSGYSICNKLKKDPMLSIVPLVLTSAQASEETFAQHRRLKTHAEAYLRKPYEAALLCQTAAKFIALGAASVAAPPTLVEEATRPSEVPWATQSSFDLASVGAPPAAQASTTLEPGALAPHDSFERAELDGRSETQNLGPTPSFDAAPDPAADAEAELDLAPDRVGAFADADMADAAAASTSVPGDRLSEALDALAMPSDVPELDASISEPTLTQISLPPMRPAAPALRRTGDDADADAVGDLQARLRAVQAQLTERELQFNEQLAGLSSRLRRLDELQQQNDRLRVDNERLQLAVQQAHAAHRQANDEAATLQQHKDAELQALQVRLQAQAQKSAAEAQLSRENARLTEDLAELQQTCDELHTRLSRRTSGDDKARKAVDVAALLMDELAASP